MSQWSGCLFALVFMTACGKTGPLRPPEPHGPLPPKDVSARQIGSGVEVAFTIPAPRGTADSQRLTRVEIVRVAYPEGVTPGPDPDAFRARGETVVEVAGEPVVAGRRLVIADPALASLAGGAPGWTLRYGVRVRDRRGRPSPLVVGRDLLPVLAPPAPHELAGLPTADGVRLNWSVVPGDPPPAYNLYRGPREGVLSEAPLNVQPVSGTEFLDTTITAGGGYRYVVRAVAAPGVPFREGLSSPPVVVDATDRFAPAMPSGLVAVQEGRGVRLLWNPGADRDLDGYRVYRRYGGGAYTRIGPESVPQPSYVDTDVKPGDAIVYQVTAVDRADPPNESEPSAEVAVVVVEEPKPPGSPS